MPALAANISDQATAAICRLRLFVGWTGCGSRRLHLVPRNHRFPILPGVPMTPLRPPYSTAIPSLFSSYRFRARAPWPAPLVPSPVRRRARAPRSRDRARPGRRIRGPSRGRRHLDRHHADRSRGDPQPHRGSELAAGDSFSWSFPAERTATSPPGARHARVREGRRGRPVPREGGRRRHAHRVRHVEVRPRRRRRRARAAVRPASRTTKTIARQAAE